MTGTRSGRRGRSLLRAAVVAVVVLVVVVVLFTVVFPWFDETFVNDPVLGAAQVGTPAR